MKLRIRNLVSGAAMMAAMGVCAPSGHAQEQPNVRAGFLTCDVASGWGFVFGSSRDVKCVHALDKDHSEYYTGSITKFGVDIGYLSSAVMVWAVVAADKNLDPGALAGHYGGGTTSVAVGVGAGANVLVGGFKNSIALQPISIEGQDGLNVAAGIAELSLKFDKRKSTKE